MGQQEGGFMAGLRETFRGLGSGGAGLSGGEVLRAPIAGAETPEGKQFRQAARFQAATGAYGLFQHMSDYAPNWDAFKQIDKHIEYIDTRYSGSWCNALQHLRNKGWH